MISRTWPIHVFVSVVVLTACGPAATPAPTPAPPTATPIPPLSGSGGGVIAFTTDRDGNQNIYLMNADGSDPRRLTSSAGNDGWGTWSPEGARIAYHTGARGLWIANLAGGEPEKLPVDLTGNLWEPAWSHDGTRIAFSAQTGANSEIYILDLQSGSLTQLTDAAGYDGGPYWSPDDRQIAFFSKRDGNFEVYVMNADGSDQRRLTTDPGEDLATAWSPDGSRIGFFSDRDGASELYSLNADGSGLTRLTDTPYNDREPSWSPDGAWIAFSSDRDGNFEIYLAAAPAPGEPIDESSVRRLTNSPGLDMLPVWRPAP